MLHLWFISPTVAPDDYEPETGRQLRFQAGQTGVTHTVKINRDDVCEGCPSEDFFCNITLLHDDPRINIFRSYARVVIIDSMELECGRLNRNGEFHVLYTLCYR